MTPVPPLLPPTARRARWGSLPAALAAALVLGPLLLLAAPASAERPAAAPASARAPWPDRAIELAATLPVQEGGRVMPLQTWANYTMLRLNELRGARDDAGTYRRALEIVLDVMARPDVAAHYPMFVVATVEVLEAAKLPALEGKKKRDRYTFAELAPARAELARLAGEWAHKDAKERSPVEQGVLDLATNLRTWDRLSVLLEFARAPFPVKEFPTLAAMFPGVEVVRFSDLLPRLAEVRRTAQTGEAAAKADAAALIQAVAMRVGGSDLLSFLPPVATPKAEPVWLTPTDLAVKAISDEPVAPEHLAVIASLERLVASLGEPGATLKAMEETHERVERLAEARGEYDKVPIEVFLTKFDPFSRALYLYIVGFLLVALTWVVRARWLRWVALAPVVLGLGIHVAGIVIRCVLRERPPVTTLYETILFIFAVLVAASLVLEAINRKGIGFALAPFGGAVGLFIATRYELGDAKDTMPQLVAVLDTNFWLATHVTCIAIGYSAALLASFVAHVFVLGRLFGVKKGDPDFYVNLHRMTYGTQAFSLIFSIVGTILGGIWANESWGRFWGWDPKENGALLICLAQLALFHGRMGGYLRATGFAIASIFTGCVVVFSWWGVNLLGVGLHAYGFTSGLWRWIIYFWVFEAIVMVTGMVHDAALKNAATETGSAA